MQGPMAGRVPAQAKDAMQLCHVLQCDIVNVKYFWSLPCAVLCPMHVAECQSMEQHNEEGALSTHTLLLRGRMLALIMSLCLAQL